MKRLALAVAAVLLIVVVLVVGVSVGLFSNNDAESSPSNDAVEQYTYTVVHAYPHETSAFTEGLAYDNGFLYESTGLYGNSTLRRVDLTTGAVLQELSVGNEYFGEGIAIVGNEILQLTWQEHIVFVYDKTTFALLGNFSNTEEGWGLAYNGSDLIMSDGSSNLYFVNPITFQRVGQVEVRDGNAPVVNINELEYVNGNVYANIWLTQKIAVIDPQTGQVKAWIDLTGIQDTRSFNSEQVLYGIAYDAQNNRLFVTGKDWPRLFEIKISK